METPLELLKERLITLKVLANQRGFGKNKKESAKKILIFEKAISILERAEAETLDEQTPSNCIKPPVSGSLPHTEQTQAIDELKNGTGNYVFGGTGNDR